MGTGNITIYDASDDSIFETIDVTGGQVTGSGSPTIKIDPSSNFTAGKTYYIYIDSICFKDGADNYFSGIAAS